MQMYQCESREGNLPYLQEHSREKSEMGRLQFTKQFSSLVVKFEQAAQRTSLDNFNCLVASDNLPFVVLAEDRNKIEENFLEYLCKIDQWS